MKKVYLVTSGEYSDYHVEAVYSTKNKAMEHCMHDRECRIDERELNPNIFNNIIYVVWMAEDGSIDEDSTKSAVFSNVGKGFNFFYEYAGRDYLVWNVKTDDLKRAVKVVNEKRTQILAAGLWGDDEGVRKLFNKS